MDKKILKFQAGWCGPCKALSKTLQSSEFSDIEIVEIDVDNSENEELLEEYEIRSIPTLLYFIDNDYIGNTVGNISKDKILEKFKNGNK
jgi:thiol-disulfide isomerase/thioredoxin